MADEDLGGKRGPLWYTWVVIFLFLYTLTLLTNKDERVQPDRSFPAPGDNMPPAWGYDFNREEYRYSSEYQGPDIPIKVIPYKDKLVSEFDEDDIYELYDNIKD